MFDLSTPTATNITIVADNTVFNVTEPDEGENTTVTTCFTTTIEEPLMNEAVFGFRESLDSTASIGSDLIISPPFLTLPANMNGTFTRCITFEVIGDDTVEFDEEAVLEVTPVVGVTNVVFEQGADLVRISISEDDGKCPAISAKKCTFTYIQHS